MDKKTTDESQLTLINKGLWKALAIDEDRVVCLDTKTSLTKFLRCGLPDVVVRWLILIWRELLVRLGRSERIL